MNRMISRAVLRGTAVLALTAFAGLTGAVAQAKKKGGKVGGTADITMPVNLLVPSNTPSVDGVLTSTIMIGGKKFKKTKIRDVNVTIAGTGDSLTSADDLEATLTAPNGATTWLIGNSLDGQSFGPLTFDDESSGRIGSTSAPPNPTYLPAPYIGTVQPDCFHAHGGCTLSAMDNGPASGTYTLRVIDNTDSAENTVFNSWRLVVVAGKPYRT
jgi:subtilisin-like proprotein convertase family protein